MGKTKTQKPGLLERMVGTPECQANGQDGEKCTRDATAAVIENGDYIPVCLHHANDAIQAGWTVGSLRRPNDKLTGAGPQTK